MGRAAWVPKPAAAVVAARRAERLRRWPERAFSEREPAEAAGLQRGDVIQEVNHETVKNVDDYLKAANKIKKDELAVLLVNRQGNSLFVAVNPK